MEKLSIGQRKTLAGFFANTAVAWFSGGIVTPFFIGKRLEELIIFSLWGLFFAFISLTISLVFTKGVVS